MSKAGILLLAAGQASRFAGDKLLTPITIDGLRLPVIAHTLRQYQQLDLPIQVISHSFHKELHDFLEDYHVPLLICPHAHLGMGDSLAYGVRHNQDWQGWLVALADMPYVQLDSLKKIMHLAGEESYHEKIIRPVYKPDLKNIPEHETAIQKTLRLAANKIAKQNMLGHPVFFAKNFAYPLCQLTGDTGAREVIKRHWHQQFMLSCDDPGILLDIDRPTDIIE